VGGWCRAERVRVRVRVRDGRLAVDLPAGSAALITLDPGCS
jgi:hypothetical protein